MLHIAPDKCYTPGGHRLHLNSVLLLAFIWPLRCWSNSHILFSLPCFYTILSFFFSFVSSSSSSLSLSSLIHPCRCNDDDTIGDIKKLVAVSFSFIESFFDCRGKQESLINYIYILHIERSNSCAHLAVLCAQLCTPHSRLHFAAVLPSLLLYFHPQGRLSSTTLCRLPHPSPPLPGALHRLCGALHVCRHRLVQRLKRFN